MKASSTMTDATAAALETTDDSFLSGKVHLRQPRDGYRVGTDAVMLAASINAGVVSKEQTSRHAEQRKRLLDMGAGVGGISLAVCQRCANVHITAVEKDQVSLDLLSYKTILHQTQRNFQYRQIQRRHFASFVEQYYHQLS